MVVVVGLGIGLFLTFKPNVCKFYVHSEQDVKGVDFEWSKCEFMIKFNGPRSGKRLSAERLLLALERMSSRECPLTFYSGSRKVTIVINGCVDGVPLYRRGVVGQRKLSQQDSAGDSGSGLANVQCETALGSSSVFVAEVVCEPSADEGS